MLIFTYLKQGKESSSFWKWSTSHWIGWVGKIFTGFTMVFTIKISGRSCNFSHTPIHWWILVLARCRFIHGVGEVGPKDPVVFCAFKHAIEINKILKFLTQKPWKNYKNSQMRNSRSNFTEISTSWHPLSYHGDRMGNYGKVRVYI